MLGFLIALPFNPSYAQENIYHEINWFDVIGYVITNPFKAIPLIADQPNIDKVYNQFAEYRNNWIDDDKLPTSNELQSLAEKANKRVATKEFCETFDKNKVENILKATVPFEQLDNYCDIPKPIESLVKNKL